jgi:hypothetical protein
MKAFILILSLLALSCHAAQISCYSVNGKKIYDHAASDIVLRDDFLIFKEISSQKIVYLSPNSCFVKFDQRELSHGETHHAS